MTSPTDPGPEPPRVLDVPLLHLDWPPAAHIVFGGAHQTEPEIVFAQRADAERYATMGDLTVRSFPIVPDWETGEASPSAWDEIDYTAQYAAEAARLRRTRHGP